MVPAVLAEVNVTVFVVGPTAPKLTTAPIALGAPDGVQLLAVFQFPLASTFHEDCPKALREKRAKLLRRPKRSFFGSKGCVFMVVNSCGFFRIKCVICFNNIRKNFKKSKHSVNIS